MKGKNMTSSLIRQAEARLDTVRRQIALNNPAYAIHSAYECVVLCLKVLAHISGIDADPEDLPEILRMYPDRFSTLNAGDLQDLYFVARKLQSEEEKARLGDEFLGIPPDELYTEKEARIAERWAATWLGVARAETQVREKQ